MEALTIQGRQLLLEFGALPMEQQLATMAHTYRMAQAAEEAGDEEARDDLYLLVHACRNMFVKEQLSHKRKTRKNGIRKAERIRKECKQILQEDRPKVDRLCMFQQLPFDESVIKESGDRLFDANILKQEQQNGVGNPTEEGTRSDAEPGENPQSGE